jgi:predicted unusual protein kinase regulating ubiquinone biosynthesis (AarF/ABC1/UbiB family)
MECDPLRGGGWDRVLTMERLTGGERLTDLDAVRRITGTDPESVLINALNTWFGSLLACDSFHADLHAGWLHPLSHRSLAFSMSAVQVLSHLRSGGFFCEK